MKLELARQQALATRDFASRQTLEQAQANRDQSNAAVEAAQATLQSAAANVDVLKLQQQEAARTLDELNTALDKAKRDLSFAVIRALFDGVIGNRAVQTGDYVQPGQRLASLVPLDGVYVDANFKETQLARLRAGQTASITVDALPDRKITGTVESFAPASGSGAGQILTVTGLAFQAGATATVGGIAATNVNVADAHTLTLTTPSLPAGSINAITVSNPGAGLSGTLPNGSRAKGKKKDQLGLFSVVPEEPAGSPPPAPALDMLRALDIDRLTPLEALTTLAKLKDLATS